MDLSNITLKMGSHTDIPTVAAMSRDFIEEGLPWSWTPFRIQRCLRTRESILLVATAREQTAGFALMELREDYAHLNLLAVAPAFRHMGLGQQLVSWMETSARVAGVCDMFLEVRADNTTARTFYRKQGFRTVAWLPAYYHNCVNAVRMVHNMAHPLPDDDTRWNRAIHRVLTGLSDHC